MAHVNAAMPAYAAHAPQPWTRGELTRTVLLCVLTNMALIALWLS